MSSRNMSLLPRATLHSDSEQVASTQMFNYRLSPPPNTTPLRYFVTIPQPAVQHYITKSYFLFYSVHHAPWKLLICEMGPS
jgi:hypothetical protein